MKMKTKAMSSKDLKCGSEVVCLNGRGRQEGVQGSGKRPGTGQRGDWDYAKVERTQHL